MFGGCERVAFYIGSYPVMKYGITMGVAIAASIILLFKIRKKLCPDISEDVFADLSFWLILAGVIGARLWYVILNIGYFSKNISEIFMINHGGISIQGAITGGIIAGFIYVKKHNLKFLQLADLYSCVLPIGQAIGRWGNFFNSEAFGRPCNLPWKLFIPIQNRPAGYTDIEYFHPTFLYESILDFCIFLILFFILMKNNKLKSGSVFFLYLILYSLVRFFIEFIRIDSVLNIGFMPVASVVCIVTALIGICGLTFVSFRN